MKKAILAGLAALMLISLAAHAAGESGLTDGQKTALRAIARGETAPWEAPSLAQLDALAAKAEAFWDELHRHHLPHGQVVDVYWNNYERDSVGRYETIGDATCWTGHYLAMLALRYKAEREPEVLERIRKTVDIFDKLTVVSGIDGYIVRYVGPADSEAYREYYRVYGRGEDPERPGLGNWAYQAVAPYENEVWLGNSSRDTYIGYLLGAAAVWAHVEDPGVRETLRTAVTRVGKRLVEDNWWIIDSLNGHRTNPVPSYQLGWMRLLTVVAPDEFPGLAEEYETAFATLAPTFGQRAYPVTFGDYFANNLGFAIGYSLFAIEPNPEYKSQFANNIGRLYGELRDHLNGYFAMVFLAATGADDEMARATALGGLIDMPTPPKWMKSIDYSDRERLVDNERHLKYAPLPSERDLNDFIWQRSPNRIYNSIDVPYEYPGLDVLLPYWMGRAYGIIEAPGTATAEE